MLKKSSLFVLLGILFIGCASTKPVPLAYASNQGKDVAYVHFPKDELTDVVFVTYNGKDTKDPDKNSYWSPVELPAGEELTILLSVNYLNSNTPYASLDLFEDTIEFIDEPDNLLNQIDLAVSIVKYTEKAKNMSNYITFLCPELDAGCEYEISFVRSLNKKYDGYVRLANLDTGEVFIQEY